MSNYTMFWVIVMLLILFAVLVVICTLAVKFIYRKFSVKHSLKMQEQWFNSLNEGERKIIIYHWKNNPEFKKLIASRDYKKVIELSEHYLDMTIKNRR